MKYKTYINYKDSGIAWLGDIPEHWKKTYIKGITNTYSEKGQPNLELLSVYRDYGVIKKSSRNDNHNKPGMDLSGNKVVYPNVLVLNKMKTWQGSLGISKYHGIVSPAYITCNIDLSQVQTEFLNYLLRCKNYVFEYNRLSYGVRPSQWDMRYQDFKSVVVFLPTKEEQSAIARFLDYKLAKINRFIRKKKQLIKLLNEQKAAIINQAVTKGLDPNVQMKDSGIEWLGEVPKHWETIKITGVSDFVRGNSSFKKDELLSEGKYVALQYGKTYKVDEVNEKYQFYVNDEFYKDSQVVNYQGVIIISTSETIEDLGHSVFYNRLDLGLLGGEQILMRPKNDKVIGKYLCYTSKVFNKELKKYATGVKVYRFNINDLKTIYTPIPPIKEQQEIVRYIEEETSTINITISKIEKEILLVEEYKTTLISEVVTGKIDVRGYVIPELEEEDFEMPLEEEELGDEADMEMINED
jgi:type I restriction enzyme S subunit